MHLQFEFNKNVNEYHFQYIIRSSLFISLFKNYFITYNFNVVGFRYDSFAQELVGVF